MLENASLTLTHGFDAVAKGKMSVAGIAKDRIDEYVAAERQRTTTELEAYFAANRIGVDGWFLHISEGGPYAVISRAVQEVRPDFVIIGTHGRTGIARALLGSVAIEVLWSVETDILVVPPVR